MLPLWSRAEGVSLASRPHSLLQGTAFRDRLILQAKLIWTVAQHKDGQCSLCPILHQAPHVRHPTSAALALQR